MTNQSDEHERSIAEIERELSKRAHAHPPMTAEQRRQQRINYAYGLLPEGSELSRERVAEIVDRS